MKISKVTISAFRAFNKKEDATFDFTTDGKKPADFVSLYAPNGFGKTSLYDAIEWGITNSIDRFNRNAADHSKSSVEERKKDKNRLLLRHNGADPRQEAFVEVQTDGGTFHRTVPNTVYDFKRKGENLFFKNVILSQDAIDSFLREENPEQRYQKFLDSFPELKKLDVALNNVIKLQSANQDNITANETEKTKLEKNQLSLNFEGDDKILKAINDEIRKLISLGEKLEIIERNFSSGTELKILDTRLSSRIFDLETFLETTKQNIAAFQLFFVGDESDSRNPGITGYYQQRESISVNRQELEKLDKILGKLGLLHEHKALYSIQEKDQTEVSARRAYFQQFVVKMEGFNDSVQRINSLQRNTTAANIRIKDVQSEQGKKRAIELETSEKIIISTQSLSKVREDKALYPSRLAMLTSNREAAANIYKDLETLNNSRKLLADERTRAENDLIAQDKLLDQCDTELQKLVSDSRLADWQGLITEIGGKEDQILELEYQVGEIVSKLEKGDALNEQISQLISLGLEILSRDEPSTCPLCRHDYASYTTLSERITANDALDRGQKELLENKNKLQTEINKLIEECKVGRERIKTGLREAKSILSNRLEALNTEDRELDNKLVFFNENLEKLRLNRNKNIYQAMQDNPEAYLDEISRDETRILGELAQLEERLTGIKTELESLSGLLISESVEVEDNIAQINALSTAEDYTEVKNFIDNNLLGVDEPAAELAIDIELIEKQLTSINEKQQELKLLIADLEAELGAAGTVNELKQEREAIKARLEERQRLIVPYEREAVTKYQLNLGELSLSEAVSASESIRKSLESAQSQAGEHLLIFQKISGMKADTFAYLESARTADLIADIRRDNAKLEKVNQVLNRERESLTNFISAEVKAFFNTDLINQIYFKIEPHPEYIAIEFECSFVGLAKPRLELWVLDRDGGRSIPTLYFSSAQINILSLSVFLARALTAKDQNGNTINCIFIDDPIQSMDSINVLSFVDLFRSLVVSFGKQIIISTHEENFHNLLQKKVPRGLFNSKFLSLETFGKVAAS